MDHLTSPPALALLAALTALVACGEQGSGGQWFREAGAQIESPGFGDAVTRNMAAQICYPGGRGRGPAGTKIGSTPRDPIVVLDPVSTPANPVYRVHCTGRLDGKYAQVIYRDYVASAGQDISVTEATAE